MDSWVEPEKEMPDEGVLVWVRVHGDLRPRYYRIGGRWYALVDLDHWRMRDSPYWKRDRAWYLKTEDIDVWRAFDETDAANGETPPGSTTGL